MSLEGKKVYVAGKTDDWKRVRVVQRMLEARQATITHDWTVIVLENGGPALPESGIDEDTRRGYAQADVQGVRDADFIVALMSEGVCGTLLEIGIAIERGIPICIVGKPERNTVFFSLDHIHRFASIAAFRTFVDTGLIFMDYEEWPDFLDPADARAADELPTGRKPVLPKKK